MAIEGAFEALMRLLFAGGDCSSIAYKRQVKAHCLETSTKGVRYRVEILGCLEGRQGDILPATEGLFAGHNAEMPSSLTCISPLSSHQEVGGLGLAGTDHLRMHVCGHHMQAQGVHPL